MLNLENTSNVDQAGIYRFKVNNGQVQNQAFAQTANALEIRSIPEPTSIVLLGVGLLGFAFSGRKSHSKLGTFIEQLTTWLENAASRQKAQTHC